MRLKKAMAHLIHVERACRVATVDEAGTPHLVPVCQIVADGKIYFASGSDARKVKNMRANPRVAVTVDLYSEAWAHLKGVMVQGTAALIDKGPRFRKARARLYAKYSQYPEEAAIGESDSVIVEVTPTKVFAWGFGD
jgi:nitroimidazol reductase NimA-like FMN-containing flavoprotein (pyridoxamine 5'-phosphate oxidase superfamily)